MVGVHMQIHIGHTTLESPHSRSSICSHPARTLDTAKHHAHHRTQTESTAKTEDCGGHPCFQRQHLTCHGGLWHHNVLCLLGSYLTSRCKTSRQRSAISWKDLASSLSVCMIWSDTGGRSMFTWLSWAGDSTRRGEEKGIILLNTRMYIISSSCSFYYFGSITSLRYIRLWFYFKVYFTYYSCCVWVWIHVSVLSQCVSWSEANSGEFILFFHHGF